MKAKIKTTIDKTEKEDGNVVLTIRGKGKADTTNISAQETSLYGTLILKAVIANKIALGSVLTITISDEENE